MRIETRCCIAGGGPAGMILGWLLARAGVEVVVLEKHRDFFRDFRGDTIHPSTLELMHELGVLDELLKIPHTRMDHLDLEILGEHVPGPDFRAVPTHCKFLVLMPQWDFLDFVKRQAEKLPAFRVIMNAEADRLIREAEVVRGLVAKTPEGELEVHADLVVGADGRDSRIREVAGLPLEDVGAPIDVLWMRIPRLPSDPVPLLGVLREDLFFVMLDRGDYWQCAYLIEKGGFVRTQRRGLTAFHDDLRALAPFLGDRVDAIRTWEDVKLLSVEVDRLERWWSPGLLCIGDAAHAMSPVGGVGINLAIQDAVAAANLLAEPLRIGPPSPEDLAAVQARREGPTRKVQRIQVAVHEYVLAKVLDGHGARPLRVARFALRHLGVLRRGMARTLGVGQMEHAPAAAA